MRRSSTLVIVVLGWAGTSNLATAQDGELNSVSVRVQWSISTPCELSSMGGTARARASTEKWNTAPQYFLEECSFVSYGSDFQSNVPPQTSAQTGFAQCRGQSYVSFSATSGTGVTSAGGGLNGRLEISPPIEYIDVYRNLICGDFHSEYRMSPAGGDCSAVITATVSVSVYSGSHNSVPCSNPNIFTGEFGGNSEDIYQHQESFGVAYFDESQGDCQGSGGFSGTIVCHNGFAVGTGDFEDIIAAIPPTITPPNCSASPNGSAYSVVTSGSRTATFTFVVPAGRRDFAINHRIRSSGGDGAGGTLAGCGNGAADPITCDNNGEVFCTADINMDGSVDSDDILIFFFLWENGDLGADVNFDGVVDSDDIVEFFSHFEAGC